MRLLKLENKRIRAEVIKEFLKWKKYDWVVCFSCWNATKELKKVWLNVIDISPNWDFIPNRRFFPNEVKQVFPTYFDATSWHLSIELMQKIWEAFKKELWEIWDENYVATWSWETIVELKLAYPDKDFIAVYNLDKATQYDEEATLNSLVRIIAKEVIFSNELKDNE